MVELVSVAAKESDIAALLRDLGAQIDACGICPDLAYLFSGCDHDPVRIHEFVTKRLPGIRIVGGSSASGLMTEAGLWTSDTVGLLLIADPEGDYGVAVAELGEDAAGDAATLVQQALDDAGCPGELPELVWIYQAPGREEAVMTGIRRVVGDRCPVLGGSSADNELAGQWHQVGTDGVVRRGLAVAVLFPSRGIGHAFQGGYAPTGQDGVVTAVRCEATGSLTRGRRILEIDGQPAAEVYNRWIGNRLAGRLRSGGSILAETTTCPLGVAAAEVAGVSQFLLLHPEALSTDGALTTFAEVELGDRVHAMNGDRQRLIQRAGRVADAAAGAIGGAGVLAGGLMVYCAGCRMAVGERMEEVRREVAASFGQRPFIGCFTFGEQGSLLGANRHANLMISAIAFGR